MDAFLEYSTAYEIDENYSIWVEENNRIYASSTLKILNKLQ
jgi:hypothetical protein